MTSVQCRKDVSIVAFAHMVASEPCSRVARKPVWGEVVRNCFYVELANSDQSLFIVSKFSRNFCPFVVVL